MDRPKWLVDSCLINGELDMIRARVEYLAPVVDHFIFVEATTDHSLRPRELTPTTFFEKLEEEFKVSCCRVVTDLYRGENNWPRVWSHRNNIVSALENFGVQPTDYLMISDLDEIPNREILEHIKSTPGGDAAKIRELLDNHVGGEPTVIQFMNQMFYFDLWHVTTNPWIGTRLCTVADALHVSPEVVRRWPMPVGRLENAGWHLSYFGGVEAIKKKMESIAESTWTAHPYFTDPDNIEARIKASKDLYERDGECWEYRNPLGVPAVLLKYFPSPLFPKVEEAAEKAKPRDPLIAIDALPGHLKDCANAPMTSVPIPDHLGGHFDTTHTDEPILDLLLKEFPHIREFIDIGCGPGGMVKMAREKGLSSYGVDGDPNVHPNFLHDYETRPALNGVSCKGRLVWSVEFVEHVWEQFAPNFLQDFATADVVFMTHAVPGQPGHHHVNCQPDSYWAAKMREYGFIHDEELSEKTREVATDQFTKATGMVFVKPEYVRQKSVEARGGPLEARLAKLPTVNGYAGMKAFGERLVSLVKQSANGTVLELGTFNGVSTTYFLKGVIEWSETHNEQMPLLVCCDVQHTPDVEELRDIAGRNGIPFVFERSSSLELVPRHFLLKGETFDIVLIDTVHTAEHVREELTVVASCAKRLLFHDTELLGFVGDGQTVGIWAAIGEFLAKNRQWEVEFHDEAWPGLTGLKLKGVA